MDEGGRDVTVLSSFKFYLIKVNVPNNQLTESTPKRIEDGE